MCFGMISMSERAQTTPVCKELMPASKTLFFGEPTRTMTYEEGLAFIERTRRQLDELEADFRKDLEAI
jgi:hypothetical protein